MPPWPQDRKPPPETSQEQNDSGSTGPPALVEGGVKIAWGTPGDFDRCVALVGRHMPGKAEGYCNLLHKRATGMYPATHAKEIRGDGRD